MRLHTEDQRPWFPEKHRHKFVWLSSAIHYNCQGYRTHTRACKDFHIASQESLMTTLITHVHHAGTLSVMHRDRSCYFRLENNMPQRRSSATARAAATTAVRAAATTTATPITVGDGSHNSDTGIRGNVCTPRECTYKDFLNYKPLSFKGTEGVVVLSQWFEKMESVFHISNCAMENQFKFATFTFLRNALTWWNSHMKTVTQDVAYAMDWKALKKMMTVKYCLRGEIKKLEIEL
ncbi:hypothetical protein Tco_0723790 [Tanacetum coccineum]